MIPLPRLSFEGIADYLALGAGLALGFALFKQPMDRVEAALAKK